MLQVFDCDFCAVVHYVLTANINVFQVSLRSRVQAIKVTKSWHHCAAPRGRGLWLCQSVKS